MNYKNITDILQDEWNIWDFFSVVFWYRDVGIFSFYGIFDFEFFNSNIKLKNNRKDILIDPEYISDNPKYLKAIKTIKTFLNKNYEDYDFAHWIRGLFYIYKKSSKNKVINLLEKYDDPMETLEWWRDLWLLLNFPKCCVKQFYSEKIKSEFLTKLLLDKRFFHIPFAPCKAECWEKWLEDYSEIMDKLKEE